MVFFLEKSGSSTTEHLKYPSRYASLTPWFTASSKLPLEMLTSEPTSQKMTAMPVSWHIGIRFFSAALRFLTAVSSAAAATGQLSDSDACFIAHAVSFGRNMFAFMSSFFTVSVIVDTSTVFILRILPFSGSGKFRSNHCIQDF